jgi:integrase
VPGMRKKISTGSVFRKAYKDRSGQTRHSCTWSVRYYVDGHFIEASSGTDDYDEAVIFLRKKMATVHEQQHMAAHPERVRMGQLFDLLLEQYRTQERRSTYDVERKIESRLRKYFGNRKAVDMTSGVIAEYVRHRRAEKGKHSNGTINRELAYVRRALKLGAIQDPPLVYRVPHFAMLPEAEPRDGTLPHESYKAVRDNLPGYARIALVIAYHTGARKGELRQIRKDKTDLKTKRIELPGRTTKSKKPRFLPIYGDMGPEIEMAIAAGDKNCPYLIQSESNRVYDFEKAWATACKAAGVEGTLFHDLRRTALTNMIEAGLSEKEAMEISGHRTRSVFDRYHIVSEKRLKEMAGKLDVHLKAKEKELADAAAAKLAEQEAESATAIIQ